MTEEEFLLTLERMLAECKDYRIERIERDGDILLRRTKAPRENLRAKNMALAFQAMIRADSKKPRGGGWV